MGIVQVNSTTADYAKCIEASKRIRWDIDRDVIRGRSFDFSKKFLPDGLSKVDELDVPDADRAAAAVSQIQGRTYANMFGLVERFIGAKMLEISRDHWLGDQVALEALVRFTDEELKHQELFRRLEAMMAARHAGRLPVHCRSRTTSPRPCSASRTWAVLGADLPHRAVHAGALPREHRARRRPVRAVEGRVPVPLEGGVAARDPRRARVAARGRASSTPARARRGGRRPDRAGRRASTASCRCRPTADAEYFLRRLRPAASTAAQAQQLRDDDAARPIAGSTSSRACRTERFQKILGGLITRRRRWQRIGAALGPILS